MLRVSLTLFNLQGTHRLTGRNCIIPYPVTVVKNFFQKFFELSLANPSNPFSHPTARLSHKLFYVTTGFSVCQALFSAHREAFPSQLRRLKRSASDELGYYTARSRVCQALFSWPLRFPNRVSLTQGPLAQALE